MRYGSIKVFTGNANTALAQEIAQVLGLPLGQCEVGRFSDGEISVNTYETVRGCDVFVVQPTCTPVNENLMELLIMIDSFRRASAGRITAVIPYYGYARQDRKVKARDPITAKLVADLLAASGADRLLTMDLHAQQIQGFFNIPVDHMLGMPTLVEHYRQRSFAGVDDVVVVSPDLGSVARARAFAEQLNAPLAIIDKRRPRANVAEVMNLIGDVRGMRAILFDDMIDTAGTIVGGAQALVEHGALEVYACCTHGVLSGAAMERVESSPIRELIMTNTIPVGARQCSKIRVLSVARVFAEAIERIYEDLPVSSLFTRTPEGVHPIQMRFSEFREDIE